MTTTDLSFDSKIVAGIIDHLDGILQPIGGYRLSVQHYGFNPGQREISVQIFRKTLDQAQLAADTLGVTFHRHPNEAWPNDYSGRNGGVTFTFLLNKDLPEYPETITPRTGGHDE